MRDAYEVCLAEGDEETLLNLMKETGIKKISSNKCNLGVVLDSLHPSVIEDIINKLKSRLFDEINRHYLLDWIEKIILSNMDISRNTLIGIHDVLAQVLNNGVRLSTREEDRINRLIRSIIDNLHEEPSPNNSKEDEETVEEQEKPKEG
mgnify:CR=1 FL=1